MCDRKAIIPREPDDVELGRDPLAAMNDEPRPASFDEEFLNGVIFVRDKNGRYVKKQ